MDYKNEHHIYKLIGIAILGVFTLFLTFYFAIEFFLHKITSPEHTITQMEKIFKSQERQFDKAEKLMLAENPFEPKLRPMLVNLIKENTEYKVIIDLKPLDGNTDGIDVNINKNTLTIKGDFDQKSLGNERIIHFTQSYYLDEKLETDNITKERKGERFIITIPFEDQ